MSLLSVTYAEVAPRWMMPLAEGRLKAERVDVGHHVVPYFALALLRFVVIDVLEVGPELGELLVADREPELLLRLGQREPEAPPRPELEVRRENGGHLAGGVTVGQRLRSSRSSGHGSIICDKSARRDSRPKASRLHFPHDRTNSHFEWSPVCSSSSVPAT
jgi:hypothetical protein